jgi:hypothetical protein
VTTSNQGDDLEPELARLFTISEEDRRVLEELAAGAPARLARTCPCGRPLGSRRREARYCSNACRQRAYRQRRRGK